MKARTSGFRRNNMEAFAELLFTEQKKEEKIREELRDAVRWYRRGTIWEFHDPELDIHLSEEQLRRLSEKDGEKSRDSREHEGR